MTKSHLKRLAAPKSWPIKKKEQKFIMRPKPGSHPLHLGLPLGLVLRNLIENVKTSKEQKYLLQNKEVFINNRLIRDPKLMVGFMDTVSIPLIEKYYRILINKKGKICLVETNTNDAKIKLCKIKSKNVVKKGLIQLNFSNGENILVNKKDYKIGDVVVINTTTNKITDSFKLEKDSLVYIMEGQKVGEVGKIEKFEGGQVIINLKNKKSITTSKQYIFVIGKDKPAIMLPTK